MLSRIDEKYYFEIRLISYLQNSTFDQSVKIYFAILPCSFCHVYWNIIDFSGYIPGRDFLVSAGNLNPNFRDLFTPWFINFQEYRDFLLIIWHLKSYRRKDSNWIGPVLITQCTAVCDTHPRVYDRYFISSRGKFMGSPQRFAGAPGGDMVWAKTKRDPLKIVSQ